MLDLHGNELADVWPLAGLANLRRLDLSANRIEDVSALAGLAELQVLLLDGNRVADVLPLALLPRLARLDLSGNRVADAALLAELRSLARLDLSGNRVADASPLGDLSAAGVAGPVGQPGGGCVAARAADGAALAVAGRRTRRGSEALAPLVGAPGARCASSWARRRRRIERNRSSPGGPVRAAAVGPQRQPGVGHLPAGRRLRAAAAGGRPGSVAAPLGRLTVRCRPWLDVEVEGRELLDADARGRRRRSGSNGWRPRGRRR